MVSYFEHSKQIWTPRLPQYTSMETFRRLINRKHHLNLKDFHDLHRYSVEDYQFWQDLWEFLEIKSSVPPTKVIAGSSPDAPEWFPGARLNYAENLLVRNDEGIAITVASEAGYLAHYTWKTLWHLVGQMAAALRENGLAVGDRVAAVITNSVDAVVLALATASIGAIYSSTAPDMGVQGILDRYRQIKPKFLFFETEYTYGGKTTDLAATIKLVASDLKAYGLQHVILLPPISGKPIAKIEGTLTLPAFLGPPTNKPLVFEQLPFNQPLFILFSSGTSGPPKCIVHTGLGILMNTKKDLRLACDLRRDETYFQFTTTGWMMWTLMLQGLSCGARIILYDGSPFFPSIQAYIKFINDQHVSVLGTSPRLLGELYGRKIAPSTVGSFEALRSILCTGAVLTPPVFEWAQTAFNPDAHLMSVSGGTDICAAFVTGSPTLATHAGEIQGKSLGMKVEVFDEDGNNIEHLGIPGEQVCTRPHPSLPLMLWGDTPDRKKLKETYFEFYPGIWRQGDFIVVNPVTKGMIILGRSDGVLNPSGIRFGSGEIYTVMEKFAAIVEDCICVGQRRPQDDDERVLLFLKLRDGQTFTAQLNNEIREAIRTNLTRRHVPFLVLPVEEIPYTVNGKKIEIAVKQIVSGSKIKPSGTVANPDSLKLYYKYQNIEKFVEAKAKTKL